jgi:hypothetical protein
MEPYGCFVYGWMLHVPQGNCIQKLTFQLERMGGYAHFADFQHLSSLRELSFLRYPSPEVSHMELVQLPHSLSKVATLEVLSVGTTAEVKMPWHQHYGEMRTLRALLGSGCKLRELSKVRPCALDEAAVRGLRHLTKLGLWAIYDDLPAWLTAVNCPDLRHLVLEMAYASAEDVQQIATLTQLTHLRLDVGELSASPDVEQYWASLDPLARSLSKLVRLEIVTWGLETSLQVTLGLPDLAAFSRIRELQVIRVMDPSSGPLPAQPSSSELLQGLSKLTQLEQLQLEGYSTLSPGLVLGLVAALPALSCFQIGLCKHPQLLAKEYNEREGDQQEDDRWGEVHPGFSDVAVLCRQLRPKLQVEVGFARQWRQAV